MYINKLVVVGNLTLKGVIGKITTSNFTYLYYSQFFATWSHLL